MGEANVRLSITTVMATDFDIYLRTKNPFASTSNVGGKNVLTAKSFADATAGLNWANNERAKAAGMANAGSAYLSNSVFTPENLARSGYSSSPFSSVNVGQTNPQYMATPGLAPIASPPGRGGIPATQSGDVSVVSLTKDPDLEARINDVLSRVDSAAGAPPIQRTRSARLDQTIASALDRYKGDVNDTTQSVRDYVNDYLSVRPQDRDILNQETEALNSIYGAPDSQGSLAAQLDDNLEERRVAVANATQNALDQLVRAGKVKRLQGGFTGFDERQLMEAAAGILAQEQVDRSNVSRQNITDVAQLQGSLAGRRGQMIQEYMQRGLGPLQAQIAADSALTNELQSLGGLELANTYTEYPEEELARQFDLLQRASGLRRGIREEGVQQPQFYDDYGIQGTPPIYFDSGGGYDPLSFLASQSPELIDRSGGAIGGSGISNLPSYLLRNPGQATPSRYALPGGAPGIGFTGGGSSGGTLSTPGGDYSVAPYTYPDSIGNLGYDPLEAATGVRSPFTGY